MQNDIHPLVDSRLKMWARWMRHPETRLGYPSKAAGFLCGGVSGEDGFQHWGEGLDSAAVVIINRMVDDLQPDESAAIHHHYLHAVYRMRDLPGSLERAVARLYRWMVGEGLA